MTETELILEEYIQKLEPVVTVVQTKGGPRTIICQDYFTKSRIADIRAMFTEAEGRIMDNGPALHKIHLWLRGAVNEMSKLFRYAYIIYGKGEWMDIDSLKENGASKKVIHDAQNANLRQDPHIKVAKMTLDKLLKSATVEQELEERNSWYFKDYWMDNL